MKTIFENKFIHVWTLKNCDNKTLVAIKFLVDEASADNYRGFSLKKGKKVAKWFRKIAKRLEKIC